MGRHNVFANCRNIVHKGSGDKAMATPPDVCKTKVGKPIVPIPYPNVSYSKDLQKGSKTVKVNGCSVTLITSIFSKSTGDEPGSHKGVCSGTVADKTHFTSGSFDCKFEGKAIVRHMDSTTHNNKNTCGLVYGTTYA